MLYAMRGIGKTFMALSIGLAVSSGAAFLSWQADIPSGVLYVDGEMPARVLQERLALLAIAIGREPQAAFEIFTPDMQEFGMPDLSTEEGQEVLDSFITDDIKLVIIDNLSCLCRKGKENEAESWISIQEYALGLRARGKSVLFIHHAGKGGSQRGTSKREDVLDTVINLRSPLGYSPRDGLKVEVHFEKCRSIIGEDAEPFIAELKQDPSQNLSWSYYPLEEALHDKIVQLHIEGLKPKEIAEELQVHKSTVSRHLKDARESGEIKVEEIEGQAS
jgi:putative DNA primase/helicase